MGNGSIHINVEMQDDGSVKTKTHAEGQLAAATTEVAH